MLSPEHEVKAALLNEIREKMTKLTHVRDINKDSVQLESPYVEDTLLEQVSLSDGNVRIRIAVKDGYYYRMLSEMSGISMESEYELIQTMKELAGMKEQFVKVQTALEAVKGTGYGVVVPELSEITIEDPEVIRQGNKFGVKIRSKSPSIHMIRAGIETEIAPIVGNRAAGRRSDQIYQGKPGTWRKHLGNQYIREIHPAACRRWDSQQTGYDQRRKPGEATGYYAEDRQ